MMLRKAQVYIRGSSRSTTNQRCPSKVNSSSFKFSFLPLPRKSRGCSQNYTRYKEIVALYEDMRQLGRQRACHKSTSRSLHPNGRKSQPTASISRSTYWLRHLNSFLILKQPYSQVEDITAQIILYRIMSIDLDGFTLPCHTTSTDRSDCSQCTLSWLDPSLRPTCTPTQLSGLCHTHQEQLLSAFSTLWDSNETAEVRPSKVHCIDDSSCNTKPCPSKDSTMDDPHFYSPVVDTTSLLTQNTSVDGISLSPGNPIRPPSESSDAPNRYLSHLNLYKTMELAAPYYANLNPMICYPAHRSATN
jgi:hypothetical protein